MGCFLFDWLRGRHGKKEAQADCELEKSRGLSRQTREAVRPLARAHERNQFSDMIRGALTVGYERRER